MARTWSPSSWQTLPAAQQPDWPDSGAVDSALKQIASYPPLVFAGESRNLLSSLGQVAAGNAFLLQAGDCAESFEDFSANAIRDKLRVILQMAVVLTYSMGVPVVKVGRMAGQFAKPRSSPTETIGGQELPSFRGYIVNSPVATEAARIPNPERLVQAYNQSASTLNLVRAFTKGGFADLSRVHAWTQEFVASSNEGQRYDQLAREIDGALRFMRACGVDTENTRTLHEVDVYTSHEALLLGYEEALTRQDSLTGGWYDCSAHMLWIGERTRQLDGAHIEFLRGVNNPLGCKIGADTDPAYVLELCEQLNPSRIPGRLTLITRMGAEKIESALRPLLRVVKDAGHPVVWACDPMHANTFTAPGGRKTREFEAICNEIAGFVAAHRAEGTWPGGIHVELTGDNVTECLGGAESILDSNLDERYETVCDPRLNGRQSLDLAFRIAELIRVHGA
ncbi:MAG: 3-deoxy-7-phosphoheptulonate synthase class II [Ilumatobacteraceae bacterium]